MYDIIGDIHGQADRLYRLLTKLGYQKSVSGWRHSHRKAVFVGDYIDRNADQLDVLNAVRAMVDNGDAFACMGNHELNAIGWYNKHPQTEAYLRSHSSKNKKQHQAFLNAVKEGSLLHEQWVDWFKTLPVYLDLPEIRALHACWDKQAIELLNPFLDDHRRLKPQCLHLYFDKTQIANNAINVLLKGKEITIPDDGFFYDKERHRRHKIRIKWWLSGAMALSDLAVTKEDIKQLSNKFIDYHNVGYSDSKPVFIGHYWMRGKPKLLTSHVACVDYSAASNDGKLVAYRWDGEQQLQEQHFVYVT